jgi:hypothetical protein
MATYRAIQEHAERRTGRAMQSCCIAHVRELNGLQIRSKRTTPRKKPCPRQ